MASHGYTGEFRLGCVCVYVYRVRPGVLGMCQTLYPKAHYIFLCFYVKIMNECIKGIDGII